MANAGQGGAGGSAGRMGPEFDFELYRYIPSLPAAIISVVVFAILTVSHTWRLLRARAFYFTAFTVGGLCESSSQTDNWRLNAIVINTLFYYMKFKRSVIVEEYGGILTNFPSAALLFRPFSFLLLPRYTQHPYI